MKVVLLLVLLAFVTGCQCVQLSDYKVCQAAGCPGLDGGEVDGGEVDGGEDAGGEDAGGEDAGGEDAGLPCIPDGSIDIIDALGADSDCDGTDGVRARQLYVSSTQGNDATAAPGNPQRPFATLNAAFSFLRAVDAGTFDALLVTTGQYAEQDVTWDSNVDVFGGRAGSGTWPASGAPSSLEGGTVALTIQGVQGHVLRDFQVRAAAAGPMAASIAAMVIDGAPAFIDVELVAGPGGAGLAGVDQLIADAGPGLPGAPSTQSQLGPNDGPGGVCRGEPAFAGGAAAGDGGMGDGGMGEGPGGGTGGSQVSCNVLPVTSARNGLDGADGDAGVSGAGATAFGSLSGKTSWVGADGVSGGSGGPGKPGSGGGGGALSPCPGDPDAWSGGSGGSGGCPGGGGGGGRSGGPSFGLVVRGGRPVLAGRTTVQASTGGSGGAGSPGGSGFPGGNGGAGSADTQSCRVCFATGERPFYGGGGSGGHAGAGGRGGPGGGGAGGHSIAVFCENDAGFVLDAGFFGFGQPGAGGLPGARAGTIALTSGCSP